MELPQSAAETGAAEPVANRPSLPRSRPQSPLVADVAGSSHVVDDIVGHGEEDEEGGAGGRISKRPLFVDEEDTASGISKCCCCWGGGGGIGGGISCASKPGLFDRGVGGLDERESAGCCSGANI